MSYIASEIYDALRELGLSEAKARAAAGAIPGAQDVATRHDIAEFRADIARDFQTLYHRLWIMGAAMVAVIVGLNSLFS